MLAKRRSPLGNECNGKFRPRLQHKNVTSDEWSLASLVKAGLPLDGNN